MKRIITAFAAAVLAGALSLCAAAAEFGKTAVLGDSIATGYGLSGYSAGDNFSAAESFASLIKSGGSDCVNLAVDGRTSAELLEAVREGAADLADRDCFVISIGGNDLLMPMFAAIQDALVNDTELMSQIINGETEGLDTQALMERFSGVVMQAVQDVDMGETAANLEAIVSELKAAAPDSRIFILTVYNPFKGAEGLEDISALAEKKLGELNSAINSLSGVTVADVYGAFRGNETGYTNIGIMDVHPSAAGHAEIYSLLCAAADGAVPAMAPAGDKTSPDTGAASAAAAAGAAALALAGVILARVKR